MLLPDSDAFLDKILSFVRFPFDRPAIRAELENHIEDKTQQYIESGIEKEAAEKQAVVDMGDAKKIGAALNKEHSPLIGWLWIVTNFAAVFSALWILISLIDPFATAIFSKNPIDSMKKDDIVYHIKVDKTVLLDNDKIKFTDVIYHNDGMLNILYERDFNFEGWGLDYIGKIEDNLGNSYPSSGGRISAGYQPKCMEYVKNFSNEADTLIIDYDRYNRQYRVEIPLKSGDELEQN